MKNFKVLFLSIAAAALLTACNDAIDITQPSELSPERAFETVNDLQLGLNGVYSSVPGESQIYFTSLFTDEVKIGRSNGGQGLDGELGFVLNTNSSDAANIWVSNYSLINAANRLIVGAEGVTPEEGEEQLYNSIVGQAYALRAFGHFQLLEFFSPDMTDDNALGVPVVDYIPTTDAKPPRNTTGEVFQFIESDLAFADENITDADVNAVYTNRGGFTTAVINALRARMYVYREMYTEAEPYLLNWSGTLTTRNTYANLFLDTTTGEVLWKLRRTPSGATGNFYQYWSSLNSTTTGSPFFEVATALYDELAENGTTTTSPSDIRLQVVIDPSAGPSYIIKPVGKYSKSYNMNLNGDIKVFRYSEQRLLMAEYYISQNDLTQATQMINLVRRARIGNAIAADIATPTSAQEAWRAVLKERRLEFAFEGFRYLDIKRLKEKANQTVDRSTADFSFNNAYDLPVDDHRWTLPIPRQESAANPAIQQNPGY